MRLFACGFVGGAWWLQQQASLPAHPFSIFVLVVALTGVLLWRCQGRSDDRRTQRVLAYAALLLCGFGSAFYWSAWRAEARLSDRLSPALEQQDMLVQGVVVSLPNPVERGVRFVFRVEWAQLDGQLVHLPSQLAIGWYSNFHSDELQTVPEVQPGQRWQLKLRMKQPHGSANPYGFDYEYFLLEQGIGATGYVRPDPEGKSNRLLNPFVIEVGTLIERARYQLRRTIYQLLPDAPYAGVMVALVLGDQNAIPQAQWQLFSQTGISHLVSISGLHVTMVAGMFAWCAGFLWRRHARLPLLRPAQKVAVLTGAVAALLYCLLAGWGVPAQRTFVMLLVVAAALWLDRLTLSSHILALAMLAVIALDPWAVMAPGFWLSFFAVALIMLVVQRAPLQSVEPGWRNQVLEAGKVQFAITLGLAPLTLLLFQQVSIIGPLANAVAIPVVSFLVTPIALVGAALATWLPFPQLLQLAHALFAWLMIFLEWLAHWPFALWTAPTPSVAVFVLALIGSVIVVIPRSASYPWLSRWRWLALLAWLPMFFIRPSQPAPGEVWLTAFDIGQGMALLVETREHRLLYDTGPQYSAESDSGSRVLLPYLRARGIRELDVMMISHQDNDHSGGALSVLRGVTVHKTLSSLGNAHRIAQASRLHEACREGQQWQWDGVTFAVLHPDATTEARDNLKPNAHSCVLQITRGTQKILLAGDIEAPQEKRLVAAYGERLRSDILLAPHHGSGTSSTESFLSQVQPRIALFQVGYLNRFHHPKLEVWERYAEFGIARERTDQWGALELQLSTAQIGLQRYRQVHARYWYPNAQGNQGVSETLP